MTIAPSGIERWNEGDTQPQTKFNIMAVSHNLWVSGKVLSRTTNAQPVSPAEGDAYIITGSATGTDWAGFTQNYVAQYLDGAWLEYAPIGAVRVYVADEALDYRWNGSAWAVPTAANEFADNVFRIQDNGDATKEIAFQASGITTGTTRTITMPDADVDLGNITDSAAIHDNVAGEIAALTEKGTPVNGDWAVIEDSADSNNKKKVQLGNLPGGSGGAMTKLGTATVAGAAATTLTLGSLDLSSYTAFMVVAKLKNATGSTASISLYYNGDTTDANYNRQVSVATGTSHAAARVNNAFLFDMGANELGDVNIQITLDVDGKARAICNASVGFSSIAARQGVSSWTTAANVTSLTLSSSVASALDVGTTFTVYGIS